MRMLATALYYVLLWLRLPMRIVTVLGGGFFFFVAVLCGLLYLAFPQPSRRHTTGEMLLLGALASFGLFLVGQLYDRVLRRINLYLYRFTPSR
jgi:hypothetical protein